MSDGIQRPTPGGELILFQTEDGKTRVECRFAEGTVWLPQVLMAELFQSTVANVNIHLKNIYAEKELSEAATIKEYLIVRQEGSRQVSRRVFHYNLEAILPVGFRVQSPRGPAVPDCFDELLERSQASGTSKETEIKLVNVARASLEELLEDYRDFLRTGGHRLWEKNSKEALFVRKLGTRNDASYESYKTYIDTRPPEIAANILICLIHQTNYLLDQQLRALEAAFLAEGGLRERMTHARLEARRKQGGQP
jgi:four helix bundle suffix protein